jgi:hypothetical protein
MLRPAWQFPLLFVMACTSGQAQRGAPPVAVARWGLDSTPQLAIGVVEGTPEYELYDVIGSLRLSDGRIVVASASRELTYFSPEGRFLRKSGGKGGGPGEFTFLRRIYHGAADSLLALDWAADRVSLFDARGDFAYTSTPQAVGAAERPLDTWLAGPFCVVVGPTRPSRALVEETLRRLPRPDGPVPFRIVRPGPGGRLWIRETGATATTGTRWTVVDAAGRPAAVVTFPPRFDLHELGDDFVLGRWRDAQDVNYVQLYHLSTPMASEEGAIAPAWLAGGAPWTADSSGAADALAQVAAVLRALVTAQEGYYADHATYAENADSLALALPEGVGLQVLSADRRGHLAVAAHAAVPVTCGIAVGAATPIGWSEGSVTCARRRPPTP